MGNSGPPRFSLRTFQEHLEFKDALRITPMVNLCYFELTNNYNETSEIFQFQKDIIRQLILIMKGSSLQPTQELLETCFKILLILIDDRTKVNIFFQLKGITAVSQFITKSKVKIRRINRDPNSEEEKQRKPVNFAIYSLRFLNQILPYVREDQAQEVLATGIVHSVILLIVEGKKHSMEMHQLASQLMAQITSIDSADVLKILKDAMVTEHISFLLNEKLDEETILNLLKAIANLSKYIHVLAQANVLDGALFAIKNIFLKSQMSDQLSEASRFIANLAVSADRQIFKKLEIIDPVKILLDIVKNPSDFEGSCINQARMALLQLCRLKDFQNQIQDRQGVRILRDFQVPDQPSLDKVAEISELVRQFARGQTYLRFCEILDNFIKPLLLVTIPPNTLSSFEDFELFDYTSDGTKFFALQALAHVTLYQRFQLKLFFRPFLQAIAYSVQIPKQGGVDSVRHSLNILGNLLLHPLNRASILTEQFDDIAEDIIDHVLRLNKGFQFQKGIDISIDCELILVLLCFKPNLEVNIESIINFLLRTISAKNSRVHLTKALAGLSNLISYDRNIRRAILHKQVIHEIQEIVNICNMKDDLELADSPVVKELSNLIVELTHAPFNTELWLRFQSANISVDSSNNRFPIVVGSPMHVNNIFQEDQNLFQSDGSVLFNFGDYLLLQQMPDTIKEECAVCTWFQIPPIDTKEAHTLLQNCKGFGGLGVIDREGKRMYCYDEVSGLPVDCGINIRALKPGWHHLVINIYNKDFNAIEVFLDGQIITDREPCRFVHRFRVIGNSLDGMEPFGQMRDFRIYSGTLEINDIKKIFHRKQDEITNMINKLVTPQLFEFFKRALQTQVPEVVALACNAMRNLCCIGKRLFVQGNIFPHLLKFQTHESEAVELSVSQFLIAIK